MWYPYFLSLFKLSKCCYKVQLGKNATLTSRHVRTSSQTSKGLFYIHLHSRLLHQKTIYGSGTILLYIQTVHTLLKLVYKIGHQFFHSFQEKTVVRIRIFLWLSSNFFFPCTIFPGPKNHAQLELPVYD